MRLAFLFFFLASFAAAISFAEGNAWKRTEWRIPELVKILETVPSGRAALAEAFKKDPHFMSHLRVGSVSITESTYSRSYSLLDGKEDIRVEENIYLSRSLQKSDAVVDLAHELTHFAWKEFASPYHLGYQRNEFVRHGIEGRGGELDAFQQECLVAWELKQAHKDFPEHRLCQRYHTKEGGFDRAGARLDYYAVGAAYAQMDKGIPELSAKPVRFTSSYAHLPYPIALAKEYEETRLTACANNARKYHLIASQGGRAPASRALAEEAHKLAEYQRSFCRPQKSLP